jgi:hypothetical protein
MAKHLTETEVSLFRERAIRPMDRQRIDSHVAGCESCLRRILPGEDLALVYSELTEALLPDSAHETFHLSNADLRRYVDGPVDQTDKIIFESHLDICDQCREESQSLAASQLADSVSHSTRQSDSETERFSPAWRGTFQFTPTRAVAGALVVASLVLAFVLWQRWHTLALDQTAQKSSTQTPLNAPLGGSPTPAQTETTKDPTTDQSEVAASLRDNGRTIELDRKGKLIGLEGFHEASRSLVRTALATKSLPKPDVLDKLSAPSITLLDPTARENSFGLISPSGTVIVSDRPTLRWQPLKGATSYTVSVFDVDFNPVVRSAPQTAIQWTAPKLGRGTIYSWEVVAGRNGQEVRSPVAPAPRAQFKILEAEKLLELTSLKKNSPVSHLALGLTYARFGLLIEAEGEFRQLVKENPDSETARNLLRSVHVWRSR